MHVTEWDKIEVRPSVFGKGLFATEFIPKLTVVCRVSGSYLNFAETILLGEKESHCLQVEIDKYILCTPPFLYSNHSCNPNCAVNKNLELFTLQDIKPNEELFWDYSTSMLERHWTMKCLCGAKNCRHQINDFDLLPEGLQQHYLKLEIVFPFIVKCLAEKFAIGA